MQVYNIEEGFRSYILLLVTSYHILSFRQVNGSRSGGDKCHRHTMYGYLETSDLVNTLKTELRVRIKKFPAAPLMDFLLLS